MPRAVVIDRPERVTSPVIFASPHSGRVYPADMRARAGLDERLLRSSEDAYVDLLLGAATGAGAVLLTTEVPRAYVDFNRDESELDPALIRDLPRGMVSPRVAAGLGVIARVVAGGRQIYEAPLTLAEARARLTRYWRPYHAALAAELERQRAKFGQVLLIDAHSMPHEALIPPLRRNEPRPQIVLGDRCGAASRPELMAGVERIFRDAGLRVARNAPFAGAYVAQAYGRPAQGVNVIQVEIDRALYLDEARVRPSGDFEAFRALMDGIVARVAGIDADGGLALAAE